MKDLHNSITFWRSFSLLCLLYGSLHFFGDHSLHQVTQPLAALRGADDAGCSPAAAPSFWSLGVTVKTDKVPLPAGSVPYVHAYQFAYERYLRPRRCEKMSLLEIGLGCGMLYNEGHSIPLWLAFLPRTEISVFEYAADCARAFFANDPQNLGEDFKRRVRLFTGDQSKEEDLRRAMAQMGSQDVIIDDGGHTTMQQQTSLRVLLHYVKPGGVCACVGWLGFFPFPPSNSVFYKHPPLK